MCPKLPDETEVNVKGESPGPVVEKMFTAGLDLVQHSAVELRGARAKAPLGRRHADGFADENLAMSSSDTVNRVTFRHTGMLMRATMISDLWSAHGGDKTVRHIHIVGTGPRIGTTLITEAMVPCFNIDSHAEHEQRAFKKPLRPGSVYLTKTVKDILIAKPFLRVEPELYVIGMIRDPRDAVVSKHRKAPDRYWGGLRYWHTYLPYWRRLVVHPRFITVRFEDLVTHPDDTQRMLMDRLPFLELRALFSEYHTIADPSTKAVRALGGVRPISAAGLGAWKKHKPRLAGQIVLHKSITDDLVEFGYEEDGRWLQELDGVAPDVSPGYWPEYFTRSELLRRKLPAYPSLLATGVRRLTKRPSVRR